MKRTAAERKLSIERVGATVIFAVTLIDDYQAMRLYDAACASLNATGTISLSIDCATRADAADE